ncbi:hypothetical protein IKD56_00860 [bacterium]|nr:hypothetical protein [bacterium]
MKNERLARLVEILMNDSLPNSLDAKIELYNKLHRKRGVKNGLRKKVKA